MSSITPRGMSVTEAYRNYRDGRFIVNRSYQRKLVWTTDEKRKLIDSIQLGYPIPLILLAQTKNGDYEVIDGMQRLNAIFDFIDNIYGLEDESHFDVNELGTAKQALNDGIIKKTGEKKLSPKKCSNITEYQLAVTIFPIEDESDVTDIFGRVNSGGKQLSPQEKRQAGVISPFSSLVRRIATELRGDASEDVLKLYDMPLISIDGRYNSTKQGYGISAQDTFWVSQGILNTKELRDSVDEQLIADIVASIVNKAPFASSKDALDELYDSTLEKSRLMNSAVVAYSESKLSSEVITTFSALKDILNSAKNDEYNTFKSVIYKGKASNSARSSFYTVFMVLHDLIVRESKAPNDKKAILRALLGLNKKLKTDRKHVTTDDRKANIAMTKGMIQEYFSHAEPSLLNHGAGLIIDFENSLRRSKIESPRYEFKQGILTMYGSCPVNEKLLDKITEIICSMGNIGKNSSGGFIYIGISDCEEDSERIQSFYGVNYIDIAGKKVFGIEHEANKLGVSVEDYVTKIVQHIQNSQLTEPLKSNVLSNIDHIDYDGKTVIRIHIPKQSQMSFVGDSTFIRIDSNTFPANPKQIAAMATNF